MSRGRRWREVREDFDLWLALKGFTPEVPFRGRSGKRRWRWDWLLDRGEDRPIAVEYNGMGVGHQSIAKTWRDDEKTSEASVMGYVVVRCNAGSIEDGRCQDWIEEAMGDGG